MRENNKYNLLPYVYTEMISLQILLTKIVAVIVKINLRCFFHANCVSNIDMVESHRKRITF